MNVPRLLPSLPNRRNHSWPWVVGSAASAGVSLSGDLEAATVQINLGTSATSSGNSITANTLLADITGDGVDDFSPFSVAPIFSTDPTDPNVYALRVRSGTDVIVGAGFISQLSSYTLQYGSAFGAASVATIDGRVLVPIAFQDARINSGAQTNGFLEARIDNNSQISHTITFIRLVFNDASTVAPSNVVIFGDDPTWIAPALAGQSPDPALVARLNRQIRKLRQRIRKARQRGNTTQVRKLQRRLRTLQRTLRRLR